MKGVIGLAGFIAIVLFGKVVIAAVILLIMLRFLIALPGIVVEMIQRIGWGFGIGAPELGPRGSK